MLWQEYYNKLMMYKCLKLLARGATKENRVIKVINCLSVYTHFTSYPSDHLLKTGLPTTSIASFCIYRLVVFFSLSVKWFSLSFTICLNVASSIIFFSIKSISSEQDCLDQIFAPHSRLRSGTSICLHLASNSSQLTMG